MSTVDDIKSKIDLADYLREQGIVLKQAGTSFKACCPFHHEKTPSFMVNRAKQVWYCFGCSKGGDLFTFVQEREGLEFGETLKLLADRAGVRIETHDPRIEGQRNRILALLELSAKWFHYQLLKMSAGEVARQYVAKRDIAASAVEEFQIGYAPDAWDGLTSFLASRTFTPQEMVEAGMALASHKPQAVSPKPSDSELTARSLQLGARVYDRFRHRLMFPIHDLHGRVVGFTGRILEGGKTSGPSHALGTGADAPAKYVNTPETAVYKKGSILYGLPFAKEAIRKTGYAVLVEGQMDTVACHEADLAQTVASSGTALSADQLRLLKRFTSTLHVAFDADPAGEGAAERGIDAALDAGFDVRVIRMPVDASGNPIAKDADECIRKDADAWRQAIAHPVPVFDFYVERIRAKFDLRSPAGQRDAGRVLIQHLAHVADPIERAAWVRRCAEVIGVPDSAMLEALQRMRSPVSTTPLAAQSNSEVERDPAGELFDRLLAILLRFDKFVPDIASILPPESIEHQTGDRFQLYKTLISRYTNQREQPVVEKVDYSGDRGFVERLELFADREFSDQEAGTVHQEALTCANKLRTMQNKSELQRISSRMTELQRSNDSQAQIELKTLMQRADVLNKELASTENA